MTAQRYIIHANGTFQGVYLATCRDDAFDVYAQDQGYDDYADLAGTLGQPVDEARSELEIEECSDCPRCGHAGTSVDHGLGGGEHACDECGLAVSEWSTYEVAS